MEPASFAERPESLQRIRACKSCKLLKTASQWYNNFCDNCSHEHPETLNAAARSDYVETRTTADYDGVCSLLQARGSWVASQLDLCAGDLERTPLKPGVYAISLPREEAYAAAEDADEEEDDDEGDGDDRLVDEEHDEAKDASPPKVAAGAGGGSAAESGSERSSSGGSGSSSSSDDDDEGEGDEVA